MLPGFPSILATGMPISHGNAFQKVANAKNSVIGVREVGRYATGLLLENYATKGFHNKAKSCNWGPMAGFVLSDPRFTKNPDIENQRKNIHEALFSNGGEVPLFISDNRIKDLEGKLGCMTLITSGDTEKRYRAVGPTQRSMDFILRLTHDAPGAKGKPLWAVFYAQEETRMSTYPDQPIKATDAKNLLHVMAIVDPKCPEHVKKTYLAATTGDYDLWAVFPLRKTFSLKTHDKRKVPGSEHFKIQGKFAKYVSDPDLGNTTPRVIDIKNTLNREVCNAGYASGDVVHHGDEAGRPDVSEMDFPCILFIPGAAARYIPNCIEFNRMFKELGFKYVPGFNPGWLNQLGVGKTPRGNYEI